MITCAPHTYVFNAPVATAAYVNGFRDYYLPTMNAFAAAEQSGKAAELQRELEALFARQNQSRVQGPHRLRPPSCASPSPSERVTPQTRTITEREIAMPPMTPDPTFYPSPTMATQSPAETLAYLALI